MTQLIFILWRGTHKGRRRKFFPLCTMRLHARERMRIRYFIVIIADLDSFSGGTKSPWADESGDSIWPTKRSKLGTVLGWVIFPLLSLFGNLAGTYEFAQLAGQSLASLWSCWVD